MQIVYKYNNAKAAEVERKLFYLIMICIVTYNFFILYIIKYVFITNVLHVHSNKLCTS